MERLFQCRARTFAQAGKSARRKVRDRRRQGCPWPAGQEHADGKGLVYGRRHGPEVVGVVIPVRPGVPGVAEAVMGGNGLAGARVHDGESGGREGARRAAGGIARRGVQRS